MKGTTNSEGKVRFAKSDGLSQGLYLVVTDELLYRETIYRALPFLITLPNWNVRDNCWDYSVEASPKIEAEKLPPPTPAPTPTPTPNPTPKPTPVQTPQPSSKPSPTLPQTGLLWWPVPVLLLLGVVLIAAGLWERKRD